MSWTTDRLKSFGFAFKGISLLFKETPNAKIHLALAVCVVVAGIVLSVSSLEWISLSLCIGGVLAAEAINSAIENLADKVSPEKDELIGKAKDLSAGSVLIMAIASVAVGLIIFLPKIFNICVGD